MYPVIAKKNLNYRLDLWAEDGYLYAHVDGIRNRENVARAVRSIMAACVRHQMFKLVVDLRDFVGRLTMYESFMLPAMLFPSLSIARVIEQAAIVDDQVHRDRSVMFESVSRKGGYNLRVFTDLEPAIEWLIADREAAAEF